MQDNNENQEKRTQLYIIIGFAVMSLIIAGIIIVFFQFNGAPSSNEPSQNERVDKGSGETVVSPEGKTPETYGTNPDAPIYLGFDSLIDLGIGFDQVKNIKAALGDFAYQSNPKIAEISLTKNSITLEQNPNGPDVYNFVLVMDQKNEYRAVVKVTDITSVNITLFTKDNKTQVFTEQK